MSMFDLLQSLGDAHVDYVLVGGLAVTLHGYQRVTMDVDVVLAMDATNLARFIACAKAANLHPVIPVPIDSLARPELLEQWHRDKGMLAFGLREPDMMATVIDVLIKPIVPFEDLRRDALVRKIGRLDVPIASIDHLIRMKTGTGRSKDLIDIEELKKLGGSAP